MMDLTLDAKQSRVLSCSSCDLAKMKLRNCCNKYKDAIIIVNGTLYKECPRSTAAVDWESGFLISLFYEFKELKRYAFGKTLMETTSFCKDVFDFLDNMYCKHAEEEHKKLNDSIKKDSKSAKSNGRNQRG
jgi:hypothetical protein